MEYKIVYFFNHLGQGTIVDDFSKFISQISFLFIFFLIGALLFLIFDRKKGKWIFLGTIFLTIIYFVLNDLIIKDTILDAFYFRTRPYLAYPNDLISAGETWKDSSFPSGHMAITLAFLAYFLYYYQKYWLWILATVFVLIMTFARMHNGMHYPTDILAGAVLGIGYGLLSVYLFGKFKNITKS